MESVRILRQVVIKEIITEESKHNALKAINDEIMEIAVVQKEFEEKKTKALTEASLKGADQNQLIQFRARFDAESAQYHMRRDELIGQSADVGALELGSEVLIAEAEGPVDIKVGDKLSDLTGVTIVVENGVIVEIRG